VRCGVAQQDSNFIEYLNLRHTAGIHIDTTSGLNDVNDESVVTFTSNYRLQDQVMTTRPDWTICLPGYKSCDFCLALIISYI